MVRFSNLNEQKNIDIMAVDNQGLIELLNVNFPKFQMS